MNAGRDLRAVSSLAGLRPWRLALAVALGVAAVLAGTALLGLSGYLICEASRQPPILSLTVLIVIVRALALGRPLARYAERLVAHDLAFRTLGRLRGALFERIEPLAPAELEGYRDGELLSRMVRDVDEIQDLILRVLLPAGIAAVAGPLIVLGVALVSPAAGLVLAVGLVLAATVTPVVAHRLTARGQRLQAERRGRLTADLVDALDAAPELWLCGADGAAERRVAESDRALVDAGLEDARGAGWSDALAVALSGITSLGVLAVCVAAADGGSLDPRFVAPLTLVAAAAFEAVNPLAVAARHTAAVRVAVRRVLDLTGRRPIVHDPAEPAPGPGREPALEVQGLTVARGAVPVLEGVDLTVPPGRRLVVTGASGAGKTTLLEVVVRFLERTGGTVELAGEDVRDYAQDAVRREVLLSAQDPHVFASNIRENVAFARPGCDDDEIIDALDRAQLGEWVRTLPDGLDTLVGEHGRALSGGQRQRLAMARAFLADPSVLLLDEPTAHLDAANAARLLTDLWERAGDRSVVLVTHTDVGPFAAAERVHLAKP